MNLATTQSSVVARRAAVVGSAAMVAVASAASLFGQREAVALPAVLPLLVGAVIVSDLMSAYVLFTEFARSRLVWLPFLAAAYLLTAMLTFPYILTFPAVFAPNGLLGASSQTALQLWIVWHLAFPALILGAIVVGHLPLDVRFERASTVQPFITGVVAVCVVVGCAAPFLVESVGGSLPELIRGRAFTPAATTLALPGIAAVNLVAVIMLYVRTRLRTAVSLWLFVAVVASALDALMGVSSPRYSYGWYVGKIFLVLSSSVMLVAFISETGKLRTYLGLANEDLKLTRERERHLAQERVHRLANYDALTGLSNRNHLDERLRALAATSPGTPFTVLFVSIDKFKEVNDQFGHAVADRVLSGVAARLSEAVRHEDTVARFGGDEFVVLAPSLPGHDDAETLAQALQDAICTPFDLPDGTVRLTASIGIATFPDDDTSVDAVLDNADAAARQAKRAGGSQTRFYRRDFFEEARARRRLQEDMSLALLRDEFMLYYQPIVDLGTGEVVKAEALIRWLHPDRGVLTPDAFIPLAEQTGLMQLIGYWVIEAAARQAAAWDASGTPTRIAVNVSARQLDDRGFLEHLRRTLATTCLPARLLELEITESAAMTDASLAQDVLEQCRALGLGVTLDDFGTYYSSLTYLKRLPIDTVKIDRSFIAGLPFVRSDAAIVSGILSLAHALERKVVAEGIEAEQQRAWLVKAGCDFGQGYLFGRPMSPAALLARRRAAGVSPAHVADPRRR